MWVKEEGSYHGKGERRVMEGVHLPVLPWVAEKSVSEELPSCLKYAWNVGKQDTGEPELRTGERRAGLGRHRVWPYSPYKPGPWDKQRGLKIILNLQSSVQESTGDRGAVLPQSNLLLLSSLVSFPNVSHERPHRAAAPHIPFLPRRQALKRSSSPAYVCMSVPLASLF